jgi:hypothetical protein
MPPEGDDHRFLRLAQHGRARLSWAGLQILDAAALAPLATVLGLTPNSALNCASEACDRCIAALTACVVGAQPWRICPIALPSISQKESRHQIAGSNI